MLSLDECAVIENDVQEALALVLETSEKKAWERQTNAIKSFKESVMDHGMLMQDKKCVWCESKLGVKARRTAHRDHIAPKDLYMQWMFEPMNIAIACESCNGFAIKGDLDTVETVSDSYQDSTFLVVHPLLDDPEEHIRFAGDDDKVAIVGLSDRGLWTIKHLKLDGTAATARRAVDNVLDDLGLSEDDSERVKLAMEGLG